MPIMTSSIRIKDGLSEEIVMPTYDWIIPQQQGTMQQKHTLTDKYKSNSVWYL